MGPLKNPCRKGFNLSPDIAKANSMERKRGFSEVPNLCFFTQGDRLMTTDQKIIANKLGLLKLAQHRLPVRGADRLIL